MTTWRDPLGGMVIQKHPSPESSVLSSTVSNPDIFYTRREEVEKALDLYVPNVENDDTIRVLWHAVENLPKLGNLQLMCEILDIGRDHEKLRQLRSFFVDAILKPIRAATKTTAFPSHPSYGGEEIDTTLAELEPSTRDEHAALKKECLRRDGYRCMLSGKFDVPSRRENLFSPNPGEFGVFTQCCHILPFALRNFNPENVMEAETKATIWSAIYRYFPSLKGKIDSSTINQAGNIMTLEPTLHAYFGEFSIALQPTEAHSQYRLHAFRYESEPLSPIYTFTSHDPTVPLPDREFLSLHFTVAKILHVSGLIDKILPLDSPVDGRKNLNPDGSTDLGELLSRRLLIDV